MNKLIYTSVLITSALITSACSDSGSDEPASTSGVATSESDVGNTLSNGSDMAGTTADSTTQTTDSGDTGQSSNPTVTGGGNASIFGGVSANYKETEDHTEWTAQFFASPVPFPASELDALYANTASDSCETITGTFPVGEADGGFNPGALSVIPKTVSAGEVITITSPQGTYASLNKQSVAGFEVYRTDGDVAIAGPIPENLSVDIPGAAGGIPALANIAFPTAASIEFSLDGTTINWTNSGGEGATIDMFLTAVPDGNVAQLVSIQCELVDDGSHQLSADVLPAGSVEFLFFDGARVVSQIIRRNNMVLNLSAKVEGNLKR